MRAKFAPSDVVQETAVDAQRDFAQFTGSTPEDYRRVLELRYWGGLSFVAMAPELDRSPDAVRKLWYRALERLQQELV